MKKQIIKIISVGLVIVFLVCFLVKGEKSKSKVNEELKNETKSSSKFVYEKNEKIVKTQIEEKKEYETIPSDIKGHEVVGKLEIPSIDLITYILEETTDETLNVSVTKLSGPQINEVGNFCIIGHNYFNSKMFFKLKKVKKDDDIVLTDTFDQSVKYKVYEVKEVLPQEVEVLNQSTQEEREVTLITCTFGAIKRIVVKAVEVYD